MKRYTNYNRYDENGNRTCFEENYEKGKIAYSYRTEGKEYTEIGKIMNISPALARSYAVQFAKHAGISMPVDPKDIIRDHEEIVATNMWLEGIGYAKIAKALNRDVNTAKNRVYRGMRKVIKAHKWPEINREDPIEKLGLSALSTSTLKCHDISTCGELIDVDIRKSLGLYISDPVYREITFTKEALITG